jgi:hypothetical protein
MAERAAQAPFPGEEVHWQRHGRDWKAEMERALTREEYRAAWQATITHPDAHVFEYAFDNGIEVLPQWGFFYDGVAVVYDVKSDTIKTCLKPADGITWLRQKEQSRQVR